MTTESFQNISVQFANILCISAKIIPLFSNAQHVSKNRTNFKLLS